MASFNSTNPQIHQLSSSSSSTSFSSFFSFSSCTETESIFDEVTNLNNTQKNPNRYGSNSISNNSSRASVEIELKEKVLEETITLEDKSKSKSESEDVKISETGNLSGEVFPIPLTPLQALDRVEGAIVAFENGDEEGERRRKREKGILDDETQKRQRIERRMIKNRLSAARSRERKLANQLDLETLAARLEEENERLLNDKADLERDIDEISINFRQTLIDVWEDAVSMNSTQLFGLAIRDSFKAGARVNLAAIRKMREFECLDRQLSDCENSLAEKTRLLNEARVLNQSLQNDLAREKEVSVETLIKFNDLEAKTKDPVEVKAMLIACGEYDNLEKEIFEYGVDYALDHASKKYPALDFSFIKTLLNAPYKSC